MESFIYILIGFLYGKYESKIIYFISKQIFKLRYVFNKKKHNYNDFYECTFKEKDFEKGE